jgi:hypothetical protein
MNAFTNPSDSYSADAGLIGKSSDEAPSLSVTPGEQSDSPVPTQVIPTQVDVEPDHTVDHLPQTSALMTVRNGLAFAFSALLSPYLVIPAGTVSIVASTAVSRSDFFRWTGLSIFFSTIVPALYVILMIWRGKITDVHVMEREQRGGPFTVALISSVVGALILRFMKAPAEVWAVGLVLFVNGLIMLQITKHWKISIHVAVLSATILAAIIVIDGIQPLSLVWLVPALIWARVTRGRHTVWQGMAACVVACFITASVMYAILWWPRSVYER